MHREGYYHDSGWRGGEKSPRQKKSQSATVLATSFSENEKFYWTRSARLRAFVRIRRNHFKVAPHGGIKADRDNATVPIACTLGSQSMQGRLDEWQRLLAHVVHREPIEGGLRATFEEATPLDELIRLAAAEQDCCRFFTFAITIDARGVALEVRSPVGAMAVLQTLFGNAR